MTKKPEDEKNVFPVFSPRFTVSFCKDLWVIEDEKARDINTSFDFDEESEKETEIENKKQKTNKTSSYTRS